MPECISGKMSFLNLAALTVVHLKNKNPNVKQGSAGSVMGNLASSVVSWLIGNVLPPLNNSISTLMRSETLQDHALAATSWDCRIYQQPEQDWNFNL